MGKSHTRNDMRSITKNPNDPAYKAAADNRSNQLNPQHPAYASSRKGGGVAITGYGELDEDDEMVEVVDDLLEGMSIRELRSLIQRVLKDTPGRLLPVVEGACSEPDNPYHRHVGSRKSLDEMSRSELMETVWRLSDEDWERAIAGVSSVFEADADFENFAREYWVPRYFFGKPVRPPQYQD